MIRNFFYAFLILFNLSVYAFDPINLDDENLSRGFNLQVWSTALDEMVTTRNPVHFATFKNAEVFIHPKTSTRNLPHISVGLGETTLYATMHNPDTRTPGGLFKTTLSHHYLVQAFSKNSTELSGVIETFVRFTHALAFNTQNEDASRNASGLITFYTKTTSRALSSHLSALASFSRDTFINTKSFIFDKAASDTKKGKSALQYTIPSPEESASPLSSAVTYFARLKKEKARIEQQRAAEQLLREQQWATAHLLREQQEQAEKALQEQRHMEERLLREKTIAIQDMMRSVRDFQFQTQAPTPAKDFDRAFTAFLSGPSTLRTTGGNILEVALAFKEDFDAIFALHKAIGSPFIHGLDQKLQALETELNGDPSKEWTTGVKGALQTFKQTQEQYDSSATELAHLENWHATLQHRQGELAESKREMERTLRSGGSVRWCGWDHNINTWNNGDGLINISTKMGFAGARLRYASTTLDQIRSLFQRPGMDLHDSLYRKEAELRYEIDKLKKMHFIPYLYSMNQYRLSYQAAIKKLAESLQAGDLPDHKVLEDMGQNLEAFMRRARAVVKFTSEDILTAAQGVDETRSQKPYLNFMENTRRSSASQALASLSTQADFLPTLLHIMQQGEYWKSGQGERRPMSPRDQLAQSTPNQIVEWFENEYKIDPLNVGFFK